MNVRLESLEVRALLSAIVDTTTRPQVVDVKIHDIQNHSAPMTFSVDWSAENGVSHAWLKHKTLRVITPSGDTLKASIEQTATVGGNVRATYAFQSSDGKWNESDSGNYSITLRSIGASTPTQTLAQFQINVESSFGNRDSADTFDVLLAWNNFQADRQIPENFLNKFNRPIWMNEAQWGFDSNSLGASVGDNASNTAQLDAAFAYAKAHGNMVVVDLESYWPVYNTWWYGGTGSVTPTKISLINQRAAQALQFLQNVAARKPEGVKLAAYVPNGLMWGGRAAFETLIVHHFVGQFTPYLDHLVIDVYRHVNDATPAIYENRVSNLIESYSQLEMPMYGIAWPHAEGTIMNDDFRNAVVDGLKSSRAKGVIIWDDITRDWSFDIALMLTRFLSARVTNDFSSERDIVTSLIEVNDDRSLWSDVSKII